MRLLWVQQPVPQAVVSSWVTAGHSKECDRAKESLSGLRLWQGTKMPGGMEAWMLNGTFRANLKMALSGGGQPWTMSAYLEPDPKARDTAFLDEYATERWGTVLHYMVASSQQGGISADAVRTLLQAGLMTPDQGQDSAPVITRQGFQFLLMDRSSQVWFFMLQYLDSESGGVSLILVSVVILTTGQGLQYRWNEQQSDEVCPALERVWFVISEEKNIRQVLPHQSSSEHCVR